MARLEGQRRALQRVPSLAEVVALELEVGEHEAVLVECDAPGQPFRAGLGADEREQRGAGDVGLTCGIVTRTLCSGTSPCRPATWALVITSIDG